MTEELRHHQSGYFFGARGVAEHPPTRKTQEFERSCASSGSGSPIVSVVVPSYQAVGSIRSALKALVTQNTTIPYEIIVIDSSSDGTEKIVEREFPHVRLVHLLDRRHVGGARNVGIEVARGEVILFTDTDTIPCATWVEQMSRAIIDKGVDGVGGAMRNGTPWSITGSAGFYLEFFRFMDNGGQPRPARFLVGGNSGFRREIFKELKYAERSQGEDMLFSAYLARKGGKLLFLPTALVWHQNREGLHTVLTHQRKLGGGAVLYRSLDSPKILRLLRSVPSLIFLAPVCVMPWIAWRFLSRRCVADLLRFLVILPACFVVHLGWALGFYKALREAGQADNAILA